MDLFDMVPDNFFSILSSKNKKLYLACLIESFKVYEMGSILGIDKRALADELTHYLEKSQFKFDSSEDEIENELVDEDVLEAKASLRSLAYYVLRKFEECGWIYIDVNSDYQEILNFTDAGITIIEAIMQINPFYQYRGSFGEDELVDMDAFIRSYNANEYTGYIYTIYSLLTNPMNTDYAMILNEVYRNTKHLIRSLRKLDSRMKDYISSVVEASEIRDLINKLMDYKNELFDGGYSKLKTSDNINKYRLPIVTRLEEFEQNEAILYVLTEDYKNRYHSTKEAYKRVYRDLDELIDVFNSLDSIITEIDYKNKRYIDSTIGKIKFLLSEDDNITGKINTILKFIKFQNKHGKIESAINSVQSLFELKSLRPYNQEHSLYTPRGKYQRVQNRALDLDYFDFDSDAEQFLKEYGLPYNEEMIMKFINEHKIENEFKASDIIGINTDLDTVLMVIYSLIYACEQSWDITKLESDVRHYKFTFNDFMIKVGE